MNKKISLMWMFGGICFCLFSLFSGEVMANVSPNFDITEISISEAGKSQRISGGYDAVGVMLPRNAGENSGIEFSPDGGKSWKFFDASFEHSVGKDGALNRSSELMFIESVSEDFRFRIENGSFGDREKISFFFVNTQNTEEIFASSNALLPQAAYARDDDFFLENGIISRNLWGADESLRYEVGTVDPVPPVNNPPTPQVVRCQQWQTLYPEEFTAKKYVTTEGNKKLRWGYRYSPEIQKIVVHHTAENAAFAGDRTPEQVMRAIYSYHANGRGWGDIGYNFVIAPDGKIFEGRAGGDYVVGGHVYCANVQTIGVSLMGNFQEKNATEKQLKSLQKLLRGLSKKYNIDPTAESMFHGKFTGNVVGHRDYGATACPGANLYELLSPIRYGVDLRGLSFQAKKLLQRSADFLSRVPLKTLKAGDSAHYILQFKNTGAGTWDSDTWLFADLPATDVSLVPVDGKSIFYAAKLREASVAPGEIGTFEVDIMAGFENGLHTIEFSPVVDSRRIQSASVVIPIQAENAEISADFQKFDIRVLPNKKSLSVSLSVLNKGNSQFVQNDTLLKVQLENTVRFLKMKEETVGKNQVAHFVGTIPVVGTKNEKLFSAVLANRNGVIAGAKKKTKVVVIDPSKVVVKKSRTLESKKTWSAEISGMVRKKFQTSGTKGKVPQKYFSVVNTGNTRWQKKNIQLVAIRKGERHVLYMQENSVAPGKSATFYLKGKTKMTSHQVFRLQLRYKEGYKVQRFSNTKFRWIVLPSGSVKTVSAPVVVSLVGTQNRDEGRPQGYAPTENINKNIRIKLDDSSITGKTVEFSGEFDVILDGNTIMKKQRSFILGKSGEQIWGNGFSGNVFRLVPSFKKNSGVITVSSWERRPSWDTSLNDNQFRGVLEARIYKGKMILVNELPLEEYLLGLAEVSDSAPTEKQKAIAVVARSYAQYYLFPQNKKYPSEPNVPYDGDDSPASFQKYLGYGYEKRSPEFSAAVQATSGQTVQYNGKTIKTPFFSESAGRTLSAQEKWGWTHTPYLVSVDDSWCKQGQGTQKGHGVGLSGCGAEAMALAGKSYTEILQYYYKGVSIGK